MHAGWGSFLSFPTGLLNLFQAGQEYASRMERKELERIAREDAAKATENPSGKVSGVDETKKTK